MTSPVRRSLRWGAALVVLTVAPFFLTTSGEARNGGNSGSSETSVSGQGSSGKGPGSSKQTEAKETKARVDAIIAELFDHGNDDARLRVIVTVKPGAKTGLLKALKAHGATINQDYTIIEAFAADLPKGLVRALLQHPDVVTISSDAPVEGSGITTAVTGTSANSRSEEHTS